MEHFRCHVLVWAAAFTPGQLIAGQVINVDHAAGKREGLAADGGVLPVMVDAVFVCGASRSELLREYFWQIPLQRVLGKCLGSIQRWETKKRFGRCLSCR